MRWGEAAEEDEAFVCSVGNLLRKEAEKANLTRRTMETTRSLDVLDPWEKSEGLFRIVFSSIRTNFLQLHRLRSKFPSESSFVIAATKALNNPENVHFVKRVFHESFPTLLMI